MSMLLNTVQNHHLAERVGAALVYLRDCHNVHSCHANYLRGMAASLVTTAEDRRF